jgi:hypothetical protein
MMDWTASEEELEQPAPRDENEYDSDVSEVNKRVRLQGRKRSNADSWLLSDSSQSA